MNNIQSGLVLFGLVVGMLSILFYFLPRAVHGLVESGELGNLQEAIANFKREIKLAIFGLNPHKPEHKCRKIATAHMAEGRDWWVGELLEPVLGHEIETHCLHMLTPLKDIVFLVNDADFQWLTVLGRAACGPISEKWLESVTRGAIKRAGADSDPCPTCGDTGCPFPEHREHCGIHHCPDCKPAPVDKECG